MSQPFSTGIAAKSVDIKQKSDLLAKKNDTTEIKCTHNDNSMQIMLWYQRKDTAMNLIVYNYGAEGKPVYEDDLENHFQMKRQDILNGALTISDLHLSDSAVYYCAVSMHSAAVFIASLTKNKKRKYTKVS